MGLIDGLCTNPDASPESRNMAIDTLVQQVLDTARKVDMKSLVAWSRDSNTLERSFRHGFERFPAVMITYDLRG
jgi:N-acetylglutamate synthase-like GNAT family acetyltransferase